MNYVISITNPEALGVLEDICEELALPLNVTLHGRGTAVQSMLDLLGIESNEKRVVLSTATEEKTAALIEAQKRRLHIGVPGHGIVIAVPVKSIGGGKTVAYLMGEENKSAKTAPPSGYAYELIVVVASEGQTDLVMNAARAAGARGGTLPRKKRSSSSFPRPKRRARSCAPFSKRPGRTPRQRPSRSRSPRAKLRDLAFLIRKKRQCLGCECFTAQAFFSI